MFVFLSVEDELTRENLKTKSKIDVYRNRRYTFYRQKVNHHRANVICSSFHNSLASVTNPDIGKHVHNYMSKINPRKFQILEY